MQDFKKLLVWQKARQLARDIDLVLPAIRKEKPWLAVQLARSAESIGANISEGCGRETKRDFKHFLTMAIGSTTETENTLIRVQDSGLLEDGVFDRLAGQTIEVRKMLHGLRKRLG